MIRIIVAEDCGNAPKMAYLKEYNIALAKGALGQLLQQLANNIRWNLVGAQVIEGKDNVAQRLEHLLQTKTTELIIQTVMSHGKLGAVNGIKTLEDGSSYAFCDVYRFNSHAKDAKIQEITSYIIKI